MNFDKPVTRRESIKKLVKLWGGLSLAGAVSGSLTTPVWAKTASADKKFLIEGIGQTDGYSVTELTRKVFESAGGVGRFISKGDVVVIKPNLSWARRPEMAATTNPEVLKAVVELCQEAGAKKVRIADNTINDARRCFALSGAGAVAKHTGADLIHPRSSLMKNMNLKGRSLDTWPVFVPLVEADVVINLPVAKHHSRQTPFPELADRRYEKLDRRCRWQPLVAAPGYSPEYRRPGKLFSTHRHPDRCHPDYDPQRTLGREHILRDRQEHPDIEQRPCCRGRPSRPALWPLTGKAGFYPLGPGSGTGNI